jgi:hypothetical protein
MIIDITLLRLTPLRHTTPTLRHAIDADIQTDEHYITNRDSPLTLRHISHAITPLRHYIFITPLIIDIIHYYIAIDIAMPLMTLLLPLYITLIIDIDAIDITPLH